MKKPRQSLVRLNRATNCADGRAHVWETISIAPPKMKCRRCGQEAKVRA